MPKASHNNLGPRHVSKLAGLVFLTAMFLIWWAVQEHFMLRAGWFSVAGYVVFLFAIVLMAFRSAWGEPAFWKGTGMLFGVHALACCVFAFFPSFVVALLTFPFLTVVVVGDGLLTATILWRFTVAHHGKRRVR
jgi:hypothetical protein